MSLVRVALAVSAAALVALGLPMSKLDKSPFNSCFMGICDPYGRPGDCGSAGPDCYCSGENGVGPCVSSLPSSQCGNLCLTNQECANATGDCKVCHAWQFYCFDPAHVGGCNASCTFDTDCQVFNGNCTSCVGGACAPPAAPIRKRRV